MTLVSGSVQSQSSRETLILDARVVVEAQGDSGRPPRQDRAVGARASAPALSAADCGRFSVPIRVVGGFFFRHGRWAAAAKRVVQADAQGAHKNMADTACHLLPPAAARLNLVLDGRGRAGESDSDAHERH